MVNCCVPLCTNYSRRTKKSRDNGDDYVSYHEFPCDLSLRQAWLKAISRKDFSINDNSRVCSHHFKDEDFVPYRKRRCLKRGSIPSVFKDYPTFMQPSSSIRREPKKRKLDDSAEIDTTLISISAENSSSRDQYNQPPIPIPSISASEPAQSEINGTDVFEKELKIKDTALKDTIKKLNAKKLEVRRLKKQLLHRQKKIEAISESMKVMEKNLSSYKENLYHQNLEKILILNNLDSASVRQVFFLTQLKFMFSEGFRWPEAVLQECLLLHAVSPHGYKTLSESNLVYLPSSRTLKRYTESQLTEIGRIV